MGKIYLLILLMFAISVSYGQHYKTQYYFDRELIAREHINRVEVREDYESGSILNSIYEFDRNGNLQYYTYWSGPKLSQGDEILETNLERDSLICDSSFYSHFPGIKDSSPMGRLALLQVKSKLSFKQLQISDKRSTRLYQKSESSVWLAPNNRNHIYGGGQYDNCGMLYDITVFGKHYKMEPGIFNFSDSAVYVGDSIIRYSFAEGKITGKDVYSIRNGVLNIADYFAKSDSFELHRTYIFGTNGLLREMRQNVYLERYYYDSQGLLTKLDLQGTPLLFTYTRWK